MICSDFIDRFSDYFDGVGDDAFMEASVAHLESCSSCRRYLEVVGRGAELIRSAPTVIVRGDFYPRLRHRLYHVEDAAALSRGSAGSATTAATILGMAVLLTMVAWSPVMRTSRPVVDLSPIVVNRPSTRPIGLKPPPVSFSNAGMPSRRFDRTGRDLWERPHRLIWEHSTLFQKYGAFRLTGLD